MEARGCCIKKTSIDMKRVAVPAHEKVSGICHNVNPQYSRDIIE